MVGRRGEETGEKKNDGRDGCIEIFFPYFFFSAAQRERLNELKTMNNERKR